MPKTVKRLIGKETKSYKTIGKFEGEYRNFLKIKI